VRRPVRLPSLEHGLVLRLGKRRRGKKKKVKRRECSLGYTLRSFSLLSRSSRPHFHYRSVSCEEEKTYVFHDSIIYLLG